MAIAHLYDGIKNNQSIKMLELNYNGARAKGGGEGAQPRFDLKHFTENNKEFEKLVLRNTGSMGIRMAPDNIPLNIIDSIADTLKDCKLKELDITECIFGSIDSLGRIISACSGVEKIVGIPDKFYTNETGLVRTATIDLNDLIPLFGLCDTSSIESILDSNHVLREVSLYNPDSKLPQIICDCLHINSCTDKKAAGREKVARFYFRGDYEVMPFLGMPISLLPNVLSSICIESKGISTLQANQFEDGKRCLSALFRMLKTIPDLCDVSSREAESYLDVKRQKIES